MPAPSLIRISTDMFPERERFAVFREEFVRQVLAMDVVDHSGGHPRAELTFMPLGGVTWVSSLDTTPAEFVRDKHHLKDDRGDAFVLGIVERGPLHYTLAGEEHTYEPGSAVFFDQGRLFRALGPGGGCVRNVIVGTAALKALVPGAEDLAGHPVHFGPPLRLLAGYLHALTTLGDPPSPEMTPLVGGHLLDLVAAVLGPSRDAAEVVENGGVRTARLRLALEVIARRCDRQDFDVDALARAVGVSRRYVQGLFEETGKTFTEHLIDRRLERAIGILTDPRCRHLSIAQVAFASGFGDVSHFNRRFRRRYGDTPSGVRTAASGRGSPR